MQYDEPHAVFHTRCVLDVVGEAIGAGPMEKLRLALPDEWDRALHSG